MKADDLDTAIDSSKLSESDFAPGTKWTNAGWTRSNPQYVAKNSKVTVTTSGKDSFGPEDNDYDFHISFTVANSHIKKGNKILLGAIQWQNKDAPTLDQGKFIDEGHNNMEYGAKNLSAAIDLYATDYFVHNGDTIGTISVSENDYGEIDFWLTITTDKEYATDLTGNINFSGIINLIGQNIKPIIFKGHDKDHPYIENIITPSNFYRHRELINWSPQYGLSWNGFSDSFGLASTDLHLPSFQNNDHPFQDALSGKDADLSKRIHNVYHCNSVGINPTQIHIHGMTFYIPVAANNEMVNNHHGIYLDSPVHFSFHVFADNLTPQQLYDQCKPGMYGVSRQSDGSFLLAINADKSNVTPISDSTITNTVKNYDWNYNLFTPDSEKAKDLQNNLNYNHHMQGLPGNYGIYVTFATQIKDGMRQSQYLKATDVTPNSKNDGQTLVGTWTGDNGSINIDTFRYAQVRYFDETKNDNQVANDSIQGTKNNATNYKLNIPKGYVLDTKSPKNVDGKQYKWSTDKKSIAYTFNEDQKLNDANPINIYITHGTHNTNDNSGKSTRTIQYTGLPDNLKPKDHVQTVLFKRNGVTDDVSGETTYGDWQPQSGNGHYTAVTSPTFAGYKPDQAVVPDTAATAGKDETVTVNYSKTDQNAKLTVHDDTVNTDLNDYAENSTGLYQDQISFKTSPSAVEQELKDKGYNIVSDSFKGSPTYNADDSKNNFVIHVTHKIVPVTPDQPKKSTDVIPDTKQHYPTGVDTNDLNKDVQRSIFYKYEDNTQAEPTVVQKAHFDRTVKVDAVTQKIVDPGNWSTKDNYPEVATKSIDGYTPDKTKVDSATPSMTTNQDQTVVYHANDEDAAITYIDDTTGKVLKTDTQKAKYKQTIKFATDPNTQIQTYKDQGYVLVSSDWKDGSTYQTDPARNKFTVHLKHGTSTVTPDKPKKPTDIIPGTKQHYPTGVDTNDLNQPQQRQITYTYADSKKQASPTVTQKATFHRTATIDNVTGKTTYTDWTTSDQYPEVKSPTIEGYTPDRQTIPATKPVLNQKQDVAVIYNPNPETVDVIAQDNTGKQLSKSTLHGNYNTDYSATTPVVKGYHLIKMPTNTHGTYKTHNDSIIYIYTPDSNSVPEQTDGTPKPDKSSYPDDLTPAKRSNKLPETGNLTLASELSLDIVKVIHNLF